MNAKSFSHFAFAGFFSCIGALQLGTSGGSISVDQGNLPTIQTSAGCKPEGLDESKAESATLDGDKGMNPILEGSKGMSPILDKQGMLGFDAF